MRATHSYNQSMWFIVGSPLFWEEDIASIHTESVTATWLGSDAPLRPLGWALLVRYKDANQSVTATWLVSADCTTRMQTSQLRPPGWALLVRHKDANQSVAATWLVSADAPQGCKPVSYGVVTATWALLMRHKDANQSVDAPQGCKPALDQEARHWLRKSSSLP